jgi:hypothetical protein
LIIGSQDIGFKKVAMQHIKIQCSDVYDKTIHQQIKYRKFANCSLMLTNKQDKNHYVKKKCPGTGGGP